MNPYWPLGLAVACVSVGSILVRFAQAPPLAVAFYRIGIASLLLLPFAARGAGRAWSSLTPRHRLLLVASGVALALHFATWIASLSYTSVAASVLLVNLSPLATLGFSRLFLGESVSPAVMLAGAVALLGAGLIAAGDWSQGQAPLTGDLLALAGAVTMSAYHVIGRGLRGALPLDAYVLAVWGTAAVCLAVLAFVFAVPLAPTGFPAKTLGAFLALAVVPTLGGHGLVNRSLRHLPAPTVGLFLLGEPVGATALAWLLLDETPALLTVAGGTLVIAALALVVLASRP